MEFTDFTPEQQEKLKACKNTDELIALAKEEGVDLSDDQLEGISGGGWFGKCGPYCGDDADCEFSW